MKKYKEIQYFSGKEAALEAAHEELSALREITSFDVSTGMLDTDYKIRFEECHKRVSLHTLMLHLSSRCLKHQRKASFGIFCLQERDPESRVVGR
jgi:hypothetical protein